MQPTFDPQTNLWYRGKEVLYPMGGSNDAATPDMLYSPSSLKYCGVDGVNISPFTFHAATDRRVSSDQPSADQLLDPKNIPTQATVEIVRAFAAGITGFATALRHDLIEGAQPLPGSGSDGTKDPLGSTAILFTDANGDQGEYDAGALAWSMGINTPTYTASQLTVSLKEQGLR